MFISYLITFTVESVYDLNTRLPNCLQCFKIICAQFALFFVYSIIYMHFGMVILAVLETFLGSILHLNQLLIIQYLKACSLSAAINDSLAFEDLQYE